MRGGVVALRRLGLPGGGGGGLNPEHLQRHPRPMRLPEDGEAGRRRHLGHRVLRIGAGGLRPPAALYLAAAGVGTIGIVDDDTVDPSNHQRQVLHTLDRIGMAKVDSAREAITSLNPDVKVETHAARLDSSNVLDIMSAYDLVVDGGDN